MAGDPQRLVAWPARSGAVITITVAVTMIAAPQRPQRGVECLLRSFFAGSSSTPKSSMYSDVANFHNQFMS